MLHITDEMCCHCCTPCTPCTLAPLLWWMIFKCIRQGAHKSNRISSCLCSHNIGEIHWIVCMCWYNLLLYLCIMENAYRETIELFEFEKKVIHWHAFNVPGVMSNTATTHLYVNHCTKWWYRFFDISVNIIKVNHGFDLQIHLTTILWTLICPFLPCGHTLNIVRNGDICFRVSVNIIKETTYSTSYFTNKLLVRIGFVVFLPRDHGLNKQLPAYTAIGT